MDNRTLSASVYRHNFLTEQSRANEQGNPTTFLEKREMVGVYELSTKRIPPAVYSEFDYNGGWLLDNFENDLKWKEVCKNQALDDKLEKSKQSNVKIALSLSATLLGQLY